MYLHYVQQVVLGEKNQLILDHGLDLYELDQIATKMKNELFWINYSGYNPSICSRVAD